MTIEQRRIEINRRLSNPQIGHPDALSVNARMRAFVMQFARRFAERRFALQSIYEVEFDEDIAAAYGLQRLRPNRKLPRQDDVTVISKHLAPLGLLEHLDESRFFRLTERGLDLARNEQLGAEAL